MRVDDVRNAAENRAEKYGLESKHIDQLVADDQFGKNAWLMEQIFRQTDAASPFIMAEDSTEVDPSRYEMLELWALNSACGALKSAVDARAVEILGEEVMREADDVDDSILEQLE